MGVDCKLYNYPESGHSLMKTPEHFNDAYLNIAGWMDRYCMEKYREIDGDDEKKEDARDEGESQKRNLTEINDGDLD